VGKLIYYTTKEDGLICFDEQENKHRPVIQNRTFENFGQQFWIHGDYVYLSDNTCQMYAYDMTTGSRTKINQSRASDMQVVDEFLLFRNMDDRVSVQALSLIDIHGYLHKPTGSYVRTTTLLQKGYCCYGKHPWRGEEGVIFYFVEGDERWEVRYKTLDGKEDASYFSGMNKLSVSGTRGIVTGVLNQVRGLYADNTPWLFAKYDFKYDSSPLYERVDFVLSKDELAPGKIALVTETYETKYRSVCAYGFNLANSYVAYSIYCKNEDEHRFVIYSVDGKQILDESVDWCGEVLSDGEYFYCKNYRINPSDCKIKIFSNNDICAVQSVRNI